MLGWLGIGLVVWWAGEAMGGEGGGRGSLVAFFTLIFFGWIVGQVVDGVELSKLLMFAGAGVWLVWILAVWVRGWQNEKYY